MLLLYYKYTNPILTISYILLLYIESSLNDAKSAYGKFHFDSQFFERCTSPPNTAKNKTTTNRVGRTNNSGSGDNDNSDDDDDDDDEFYDTRYVCRVPVRSIHSILRPRKGVCSLRIKSEGQDDKGIYFGQTQKKKKRKEKKDKNKSSSRGRSRSRDDNDEDEEDDDNDDGGNKRRGSMSARERSRSRSKRRKQTKLKRANDKNGENGNDNENDPNSMSSNTEKMMLSFEFYIERPSPKSNDNNHHNNPNNIPNGGVFRVLHKVGVTDANNVTLSASVTQRRTRSEIVSHPRLWLRLLDPLRRTAEVALTIDDELKVVTATSFHPSELQNGQGGGGGGANAVLQAAAARDAVLKTETSTGCEEFDEYDFRNNRGKKKRPKRRKKKYGDGENEGDSADESENEKSGGEEDEEDYEKESEMPPLDVNEKVILVFSIKEAKVRYWI